MTHAPIHPLQACCKILSLNMGQVSLPPVLPDDFKVPPGTPAREALEQIIAAARTRGIQTRIHRLSPSEAVRLSSVLPEMKDHGYWVLDEIRDDPDTGETTVLVTIPRGGRKKPNPWTYPWKCLPPNGPAALWAFNGSIRRLPIFPSWPGSIKLR